MLALIGNLYRCINFSSRRSFSFLCGLHTHLPIPLKRRQPIVDVGDDVASPDGTLACIQPDTSQSDAIQDVSELTLLGIHLLQRKVESLQKKEAVLRLDCAAVKYALTLSVNIKHTCNKKGTR